MFSTEFSCLALSSELSVDLEPVFAIIKEAKPMTATATAIMARFLLLIFCFF